MNYLEAFIHRYFPAFAAFASLREIFRVSVAACRARTFVVKTLSRLVAAVPR